MRELSLHKHSISPAYSDSITIRFLASPINPADINQIQGTYPSKPTFDSLLGTPAPSAVAGNEGVAEVVSVGSSVPDSLRPGDWVLPRQPGLGTWRTYAQVHYGTVSKISDKSNITPVQAATVSVNPTTAHQLLRGFADLSPGSWVLQNGANSGVGRAVIQLAKLWGLRTLNVVRDRPELDSLKAELETLGATAVVTEDELLSSDFGTRFKRDIIGDAPPPSLALNCVGGRPALALAKLLDGPRAQHVTYGAMAKQPVTVPPSLLIFRNISFTGFWVSAWSAAEPEDKQKTVNELLDLMRAGRLRDPPTVPVPWRELSVDEAALKNAVQGTLSGFRKGKGIFIFEDS
ncbi:MAG: hypothetical protein M1825_002985 [Sarcosagium campestre]|nr:MAG: hypothetical protein M1825_002985 [Sarcosagium campestre]